MGLHGKIGKTMTNSCKYIYIGKISPDVHWHNHYSVHTYHELIVILSGVMHISGDDGQQFELRAGESALYPAGVRHWEHSDANNPVESCFLVFESPTSFGERILVNREQGTFLRPMAHALHEQSLINEKCVFASEILSLMLRIFFSSSPSPEERQTPLVCKIRTFMRRNLGRALSLSDLAKAATLSKCHFLRQYRQECGRTPIRDLWEIRCAEAISLLKYTDLPLKDIAQRTGFSDACHFSHRIKAFSGKLPSQFRKH